MELYLPHLNLMVRMVRSEDISGSAKVTCVFTGFLELLNKALADKSIFCRLNIVALVFLKMILLILYLQVT